MSAKLIRKRDGKDGVTFIANKRFDHYAALLAFLRVTTEVSDIRIVTELKKAGNLRLVTLSGLFTGAIETKADIIVVGDKLDEKRLEKSIHELEAELGRELRYASFSTEDFRYRVGVYDRLVRDIFDYPHRVIFDKIGMQ